MRLYLLLALVVFGYGCGKDDSSDPAPVVEEEEEVVLKETKYLVDEDKSIDQCDLLDINYEEDCYVSHARLDIYTDGSRVLEVTWFHIASDGSNDDGETFTGRARAWEDGEDLEVLIDEEFASLNTNGLKVWAVAKGDNRQLWLYHDENNNNQRDDHDTDYLLQSALME